MSLINTEIVPFKATAYHNGKFVPVSNENFKGKWSVVVFYPADFTFVCPTELGDLADHYAEFKKLGVEVYGVSTAAMVGGVDVIAGGRFAPRTVTVKL